MKLRTIAAAALSFTTVFATAQSLTFNGSVTTGDSFEGIWLSANPFVNNDIVLLDPSVTTSALNAVFTPPTIPALPGALPFNPLRSDANYNYSFLLIKVGNQVTQPVDTAGFGATLTLSGGYQFLNGTNTLTTSVADFDYWRGLNTLTNPTLTNQASFANLIDPVNVAATGLSLFTVGTNTLWSTFDAKPDQDTIFATVIRASRS